MEVEKQTLDLLRLVELKKEELSLIAPIELERLGVALQSIAKRMEYCKYHYDEFLANTNDNALFFDEFKEAIENAPSKGPKNEKKVF